MKNQQDSAWYMALDESLIYMYMGLIDAFVF